MKAWPEEALENVAVSYVEKIDIPAETKKKVVVACKYFHMTATWVKIDYSFNINIYLFVLFAENTLICLH